MRDLFFLEETVTQMQALGIALGDGWVEEDQGGEGGGVPLGEEVLPVLACSVASLGGGSKDMKIIYLLV